MPKKFGFTKNERIKSEKTIKELLNNDNKIFHYPILAKWSITNNPEQEKPPIKVAFLVSKHRFSKAIQRNLIKRRLREAYRILKKDFMEEIKNKNFAINILFIYISPQILSFNNIEQAIGKTLIDLKKEIKTFISK